MLLLIWLNQVCPLVSIEMVASLPGVGWKERSGASYMWDHGTNVTQRMSGGVFGFCVFGDRENQAGG